MAAPSRADGGQPSGQRVGAGAADPLANAGAFFGSTTLGATDPFFDAAATTATYPFHALDARAYAEVQTGGGTRSAPPPGLQARASIASPRAAPPIGAAPRRPERPRSRGRRAPRHWRGRRQSPHPTPGPREGIPAPRGGARQRGRGRVWRRWRRHCAARRPRPHAGRAAGPPAAQGGAAGGAPRAALCLPPARRARPPAGGGRQGPGFGAGRRAASTARCGGERAAARSTPARPAPLPSPRRSCGLRSWTLTPTASSAPTSGRLRSRGSLRPARTRSRCARRAATVPGQELGRAPPGCTSAGRRHRGHRARSAPACARRPRPPPPPHPPARRVSTAATPAGAPTACGSAAWAGSRGARSRRP
jgi:hypothetical protein